MCSTFLVICCTCFSIPPFDPSKEFLSCPRALAACERRAVASSERTREQSDTRNGRRMKSKSPGYTQINGRQFVTIRNGGNDNESTRNWENVVYIFDFGAIVSSVPLTFVSHSAGSSNSVKVPIG